MAEGALAGLLVLDLSQNISGPYCTKLLADYGATVIKIEKPIIGDDSRHAGPFPPPPNAIPHSPSAEGLGGFCRGESRIRPGGCSESGSGDHKDRPYRDTVNPANIDGLFLHLNTGKKSITLDIDDKVGRDIFKRLAKQADIVVENSKPGTMKKLGIDHAALSKLKSDIIMASISYFGQTGPCRDWSGCDLVAQAAGGLIHLTGEPGREPLKLPLSQAEYQAGLNAAVAVLCAVFHRDACGEGQHIDVSVQEAVASILEGAVSTYEYSGHVMQRIGPRHQQKCPSTIMSTADGYVHLQSGAYWDHFATLVEAPQLTEPPLNSILRYRHTDEVEAAIRPWVESHSTKEVFDACCDWRIPCGMVLGVEELEGDPQYEARSYFREIDHPEAGRLKYPGAPFKMSETPADINRAPLLGEHNDEIFIDMLGMSRDEIGGLKERNVI
ncbi:MAG: CoA transferase [Chloroflexota bacterium]|nr:CoA transferase [Chloroflexota bacterium]